MYKEREQRTSADRITDEPQAQSSNEKQPEYGLYPRDEKWNDENEPYSFRNEQEGPALAVPQAAPTPGVEFRGVALSILALSRRTIFGLVSVAIAILFIVAILIWWQPRSPFDDWKDGIFSAAALKGNLVTKWDGKAEYRLRIEPFSLRQQAGFAAAVSNCPHPLFVKIQLNDSSGFVVCEKEILLKFYPVRAANIMAADVARFAKAQAAKAPDEINLSDGDLDRQDAQELDRERGADIFQSEGGDEGGIAAIKAQGDLQCTAASYKRIDGWTFATNFPTLAEQEELLKRQEIWASHSNRVSIHHPKVGANFLPMRFLDSPIEGDDVITGNDPTRGILETRSGRVFLLSKTGPQSHATGWQVFPIAIHYGCDKTANCVISAADTPGAIHARLER